MRYLMLVVPLVLVACAGEEEPDVNPVVRDRIEGLVAQQDCAELQAQFDIADTNRNTDIMTYVDDALRRAGCYN